MPLRPNSKDDSKTDSKADARRNRYKVAFDTEDGRRRREDDVVEIRKNKREESLQKKRREGLQTQQQLPVTFDSKVLHSLFYLFLFYTLSFLYKLGFNRLLYML